MKSAESLLIDAIYKLPRKLVVYALRGHFSTLGQVGEQHWSDKKFVEAVRTRNTPEIEKSLLRFARKLKKTKARFSDMPLKMVLEEFTPTMGIEQLVVGEARGRYEVRFYKNERGEGEGIYDQHRAVIDSTRLMYPYED